MVQWEMMREAHVSNNFCAIQIHHDHDQQGDDETAKRRPVVVCDFLCLRRNDTSYRVSIIIYTRESIRRYIEWSQNQGDQHERYRRMVVSVADGYTFHHDEHNNSPQPAEFTWVNAYSK